MLSLEDIDNIVLNGGIVVDADGEKVGSVEQIFTNGESGDPAFVTVRTGLFGMSESFAPLSGASLAESVIRVAFGKDKIKNGPRIDSNRGVITAAQEQELYRYYGLAADSSSKESDALSSRDDAPEAAGESVETRSTADLTPNDRPPDVAGARPAGQMPRPLPPGPPDAGPAHPPPLPHLRKHVPPGLHAVPPGPRPVPPRPHPEPPGARPHPVRRPTDHRPPEPGSNQ
ncbi:PRC-barrel domain-containing protein [Arthrobacter oryzae]|uniref:PRC-barrel domain protein n=1 Tax=Arthrobacter oryzae TaxID=409290 RepID=A0A495FP05_9MICC|nr:PRC-barrel domain-containing protein [Arthrobacter oryzae]RKR30471.1 PRC-barrel domain protein [Arthrobacter oryzae]